MADEPTTLAGRVSIVVVWTVFLAILVGGASMEASLYRYRWSHRDNPRMWEQNWRFWDFRTPREAYYHPFLSGAKWGALVGGVLGVVVAARQK